MFCEHVDEDDRPMKEVILSAYSEEVLYSVPADIADNIDAVCNDFATNYIWHGSKNSKFLKLCSEQYVALFGAEDFIDYLNEELYPQFKSVKIKTLGSLDDGVPEEYKAIPRFNF